MTDLSGCAKKLVLPNPSLDPLYSFTGLSDLQVAHGRLSSSAQRCRPLGWHEGETPCSLARSSLPSPLAPSWRPGCWPRRPPQQLVQLLRLRRGKVQHVTTTAPSPCRGTAVSAGPGTTEQRLPPKAGTEGMRPLQLQSPHHLCQRLWRCRLQRQEKRLLGRQGEHTRQSEEERHRQRGRRPLDRLSVHQTIPLARVSQPLRSLIV